MWRLALVFFVASTINVRVHAAQTLTLPEALEVVEQPEGCAKTNKPCAFHTARGVKWVLELSSNAQVVLGPETTLVRVSATRVRLVSGFVWVRAKSDIVVETEFGSAIAEDYWVVRESSQMLVRAAQQDVTLTPRGSKTSLQVLSGMQNWLSAVGPKGEAQAGFPQPIALDDYMKKWAQLRSGSSESFREEFEKFLSRWEPAIELSSGLIEDVATRAIADDLEKKRLQALARERARKEAAEIRAMFRRNNFLDL